MARRLSSVVATNRLFFFNDSDNLRFLGSVFLYPLTSNLVSLYLEDCPNDLDLSVSWSELSMRVLRSMASTGNKFVITRLLVLYQIYNHLARGPTALGLGDYKSDIELVACYNIYIYVQISFCNLSKTL